RLTPSQLKSNLNILILQLASTNRETREQLKFFRDSGGNIVQHFPPENMPEEHKKLKERISNLDMLSGELVKTSLGNLVRFCEPAVILDEGHKATSRIARETIEGFNASIVVELSATPPKEANVLVKVSGKELLEEEMIKLPMNIANSNQNSWQACLAQARDKREELAKIAEHHLKDTGKYIRPMVLVQVERTGKDQRGPKFVHSEDVKEYLMQKLDIPEAAIKIKTSDKDDIEGLDLLDEECQVEWIITKAALKEGWDCPFAYILVSLNNTGSRLSMTQLVGRVLRQPYVKKTSSQELNESYVYCLRRKATDIAQDVKKALEDEGYEGDAASVVDRSEEEGRPQEAKSASIRKEFQRYYVKFEGKVYLPRFCVKQEDRYEALDYYRHLISRVDVSKFDYAGIDWDLATDLAAAKESFYRMTLEQEELEKLEERESLVLETDEKVLAWLAVNLPFEHFSQREMRQAVEQTYERLCQVNKDLKDRLGLVKFAVKERMIGFIQRETDKQTQGAFEELFDKKRLQFYLECKECRFELPPKIEIRSVKRLTHDDGGQLELPLFNWVAQEQFNEYEKSVALYLDKQPQVLWWYRNLVGSGNFSIQGYRHDEIYPDFIVQQGKSRKPIASVLVLESKGGHLVGNEDTRYKKDITAYFNKVGRKVPWQKLAKDFQDNQFRFQILDEGEYKDRDWRGELKKLLEEGSVAEN
ncbi:MAG: hypothetical protein HY747_07440, partial [Elusimicrobia bacterium]|nr:hypothetical protein [Elusimicrobiota bacterium]